MIIMYWRDADETYKFSDLIECWSYADGRDGVAIIHRSYHVIIVRQEVLQNTTMVLRVTHYKYRIVKYLHNFESDFSSYFSVF